MSMNTIPEALDELRAGHIIIVVDDPDRENEGDLICAAQFATTENVNFMAMHAKGLICTPMSEEIAARLGLEQMVKVNTDNHCTAFTVSIDHVDTTTGISAAERLDTIEREELAGMLYENSDEPYCEELAKAITDEIRRGNRIDTTTKLREIIEKTLDFLPEKEKKETVKKTCQRVFQALRIDVNQEFEVLYEFMEKLPNALRPGGRAAILTFHSGEDKLVKAALKEGYRAGIYKEYSKDVVRPSAQECVQNPRARSTKMRWAIRAEE